MVAIIILIIGTCGYLFVQRYPLSRLKQSKIAGWDAYFHVGCWGMLFATIAALIVVGGIWVGNAFGISSLRWPEKTNPVLIQIVTANNLAVAAWAFIGCLISYWVWTLYRQKKPPC